nr:MAG TPA: hypothetical protein [Caudoviricetes sp.]DAO39883.1 MAG TPA: hypothetical protein [Caudoviricetes sp.]
MFTKYSPVHPVLSFPQFEVKGWVNTSEHLKE